MSTTTLGAPLADEAIRSINFFNGRLLTGGDLSREQQARRLADMRVGQLGAPGIAWGLEVSALAGDSAGGVRLARGLGVACAGQVLSLATDTDVRLVAPAAVADTTSAAGAFGICTQAATSSYVAGDGLFLLTLSPATLAEGKAPVLALEAVNARCSTDTFVEAVQLRMLRINEFNATGTSAAAVARLRNDVAYAFFAPQGLAAAHQQPGSVAAGGLLERMSGSGLGACDLPLAVVYMVGDRTVFVDRWAVRRRLSDAAASEPWAAWLGERACALGEAQMAQFQEHIAETPAVLDAAASASLSWLPPAGFLPGNTAWRSFLGAGAPAREVPLASADAPDVLAAALRADAVNLAATEPAPRFRVYRIGGAAGPLMFLRDGRNLHHAEQLWLDGDRARLAGVADVQAAIDRLSAGTCLHLVLRPGMNAASELAKLQAGQDATICFEPGDYAVAAPLTLSRLGRLQVHGHGAKLLNTAGECALLIDSCASAHVHDIAVAGAVAGSGKGALGIGLMGALTVIDTPQATVERVQARCAPAALLGAVGLVLTVRSISLQRIAPARWSVVDNDVTVGAGQQGLLCVNVGVVQIRGNRIAAVEGGGALQRGIVVGGSVADTVHIEDNDVRDAVRGIAVGISESDEQGSKPLSAERVVIERNRVDMQLKGVTGGDRYGIFVGNAGSVLAHGNHVRLVGGNGFQLEPHGMRLTGAFGPQVIARDNFFADTFKGIVFQPQGRPLLYIWAFQCNVALRAGSKVLDAPTDLAIIDEHNKNAIELAPPPPPPSALVPPPPPRA